MTAQAPSSAASVLVYVGLDLVGDGLMKLPFVRALRAAFPDARITWLAGQGETVYRGPLAPLVSGLLDEVAREDVAAFRARCRAEGRRFDVVIDTQRGFATALALWRIPHRHFFSPALGYWLSSRRPASRRKAPSLVRQLLDLVALASGRPASPDAALAIPDAVRAEAERLLPAGPAYVGLSPGAGGKHKCWPLERYLELGRRLAAAGRVPVVILGPAEAEWVETVRAALPQALLPLQQAADPSPVLTIALGGRLACAVANDSGAGHMLAASGTALVSLFGPTPAHKFAPLAHRATILRAQDFGTEAMDAIPVEAVERAVAVLLG